MSQLGIILISFYSTLILILIIGLIVLSFIMKKNPFVQLVRDPRFIEALGGKRNAKRIVKPLGLGRTLRGQVIRLVDVSSINVNLLKDIGFPYVSIDGKDITISMRDEGGTNLIALVASEQTQTLSLDNNENISAPNENVNAQPVNNQPVNNQPVSSAKPLQDEKELDPYEQWLALQNQDKQ